MQKLPTRIQRTAKRTWVKIAELVTHPLAQRAINMHWVREQAKSFDIEAIGVPVVCRYQGALYIIDGQHRIGILREVGWGDQQIEVDLYDEMSLDEMAAEFLRRNTKINIRTFDKFRIRITAKDPVASAIMEILQKFALVLEARTAEGAINCVAALEATYRKPGGDKALQRALGLVIEAWGRASTNFSGAIVEGLGLVFLRYGESIDRAGLAKKLSSVSGGAPGILGRARSQRETRGGSVAYCVGDQIVSLYNRGRGTGKLENWWK